MNQKNHLRVLMLYAGFNTQTDLAKYLDISPGQVGDWFRNFPNITERNKERLAKVLKVSVKELYLD
jgi:transcriptional regulator with XRE-family HTH domain